uniref:Uncharacterized protein n=1 Tax=Arundo donax TaxID=35708 RepID=A0A0A8ZE28_ARUDO
MVLCLLTFRINSVAPSEIRKECKYVAFI